MDFCLIEHPPLIAPEGFGSLTSANVGPDQEACCLWVPTPGDPAAGESNRGRFGAVATQQDGVGAVWQITELNGPMPQVPTTQPHPLGWIVVGRRRRGGEDNALVFGPSGKRLGAGRVGDGIEQVHTTHDGSLWVSYFDEGVFAEDDGRGTGGNVAAAGCVRWDVAIDATGVCGIKPAWRLSYPQMADCYAMNVTDRMAYVCPYVGFPVIVVEQGRQRELANAEVAGARAMVIDGQRMALIGAYGRREAVFLGVMEEGRFRVTRVSAWRATGADPSRLLLVGRGDRLHAFSLDGSGRWWSGSIGQL
ncbi:MAG: hypothetical protein LBC97_09820 [Bifidobacteriaceae bacterium]|jgi:hypothetical protein|nr:hypothetical protein [Bifidobacteriaceae bacterium]